ncbi:hypothetical protein FHN55_01620 [Streptomyces sp. NP160]|uniref:hypothetical protein n=1 Tax=Streptomyces sp. NP160 TaxID=2586637 RepID=UPI00111A5104|nr:hypothetical protein [Streptomyces sp. NP160]TNM69918.1 hypothetical protein FHN55_01620 [Streptomyces sp. NP160]
MAADGPVLGAALALLGRRAGAAYAAAAVATAVNTVPDVLRQVAVWDSPSRAAALAVDVLGFLTGLVAQLWLVGALSALPDGDPWRAAGALRRGVRLSVTAVRRGPGAVLAGVLTGGAVSALVTLPASVAALGWRSVLGPLGDPPVGAFTVAAVSDVVASALTLPYLALVVVLVARDGAARRA